MGKKRQFDGHGDMIVQHFYDAVLIPIYKEKRDTFNLWTLLRN